MDNIGTGKIVVGVALKVIEELLQEIQGNFEDDLSFVEDIYPIQDNPNVVVHAKASVDLDPVTFRIEQTSSSQQRTILRLKGNLKLRAYTPAVNGPDLYDLPFEVKLRLALVLKDRANKGPVVGLQYNGIQSISGPISQSMMNGFINNSSFNTLIQNFELDIIDPAIAGIENVLYINETKPNRADWRVSLRLLRSASSDHVDAYGIVIDVPGGSNGFSGGATSFVPKRAEIIIQFTASMVQSMVNEAKEELSNWFETINGVDLKVKRLNLSVDNNQFYLDAKIKDEKYDAEVTMKGAVRFRHAPGGMMMGVDVRGVDINVDLPWWADVLAWFADIFTFGFAGVNDFVHNDLPNFAQLYAQRTLDNILPQLGNALELDSINVQGAHAEIYPDLITLNDGAITVYIQVLIKKLQEGLKRADYSSLRKKFIMFHLTSGRRFLVEDLASFMSRGVIEVPGYHEVGGEYIRSNPDHTENNNLIERYYR